MAMNLSLIYSIHKNNIFDFALRTLKYFEIFEVHTFLIELEMIDWHFYSFIVPWLD